MIFYGFSICYSVWIHRNMRIIQGTDLRNVPFESHIFTTVMYCSSLMRTYVYIIYILLLLYITLYYFIIIINDYILLLLLLSLLYIYIFIFIYLYLYIFIFRYLWYLYLYVMFVLQGITSRWNCLLPILRSRRAPMYLSWHHQYLTVPERNRFGAGQALSCRSQTVWVWLKIAIHNSIGLSSFIIIFPI